MARFGDNAQTSGPRFGQDYSLGDKLSGFAISALESFPELFGIEPTRGTMAYRAANPVSGFASQAVGAFVPYLGAAKLARAAPLAGSFIKGAEALGKGSVSRFALGAAAEASVVEAGRIGLGLSGVPEKIYEGITGRDPETRSASDLFLEGAFNIGGSGAIGAGVGAIAGRLARQTGFGRIHPDMAPDRPMNVRTRAMNEFVRKAQDPNDPFDPPAELLERVSLERTNLMRMNLEGALPATADNGVAYRSGTYRDQVGRLFRPIAGEKRPPGKGRYGLTSNWLEKLVRGKGGGNLTRTMRLIVDPKRGFASERELADALTGSGTAREIFAMESTDTFVVRVAEGTGKRKPRGGRVRTIDPETAQDLGERLLTNEPTYNTRVEDPNLARARSIQQKFTAKRVAVPIDNGWWMMKEEAEDGLYVLAKKIKGGNAPAAGDEWIVTRTDNPGAFAPKAAAMQARVRASGYLPEPTEGKYIGVGIWDADNEVLKLTRENMSLDIKKVPPGGRVGAAISEVGELIGDYAAPSAPGAARNAKANALWTRIKNLEQFTDGTVEYWMHGKRFFDVNKSMIRQILSVKHVESGGFDGMAHSMSQAARNDVVQMLEAEVPVDQLDDLVARGILEPDARDFLKALDVFDTTFQRDRDALAKTIATEPAKAAAADFTARKGHYGISTETPGAYRIALVDAEGEFAGIVAGDTPLAARQEAKLVIEQQAKATGKTLFEGPFFDEALRDPVQVAKFKAAVKKPGFYRARTNTGIKSNADVSANDLAKLVKRNIAKRQAHIRDLTIAEKTYDDLRLLEQESPAAAKFIQRRIALLNGDEGEFGKATNAIADKTLAMAGLSGKNSATEIVRETQKVLSDFQFAFVNLTNPLQNILSIITVTMPELMFASRYSAASSHNYAMFPAFDSANNIKGSISVLSDLKMLGRAFKWAATDRKNMPPELAELIDTLTEQRMLSARFGEENFGINSELLADPRKAFNNVGSTLEFMGSINRLLVTKSEEFNRLIAVTAGYEVAKMRGITNPTQMTLMVKDFLTKTAFNYGTVDRATMFTTPVGSLLGTFKNWMFHYTANMIKYATGGKASLPALMWQTGTTALFGGIGAAPLLGPAADLASKFLTNESLMQNLYDGFDPDSEWAADGILYGLPGALGISFSSQIASPFADPERDASMMFSLAMSDRMRALGGGVKDAVAAYAATGESPFTDDHVRDQLVRALAPRSIYRAMAAGENGAIRSMSTGYDVARLGVGSNALYALGFNPTELEKTYEVYTKVRNSQAKKRALTQEFGRSLAQAWEDNDQVLANRIYARALATGVDMSSVLRSAKARQKRDLETQLEFTAAPEDQIDYSFMWE